MAPSLWLSLGLLAGTTQIDPRLADYQWDTTLRPAWGVQALAGTHRLATGVRLWRTESRQTLDPTAGRDAHVGATTGEVVGRVRLTGVLGTAVWGDMSGGWMRVAYDPNQTTIDAGGTQVVVDLAPIDTWTAGLGLAMERGLPGGWSAGLEAGHRWFELDAAHRNGSTIETRRERFGDWTARVALARRWGRS
jgi:hypothetical protein